jgi:hypothetical protein
VVKSFHLDPEANRRIAQTLALKKLPKLIAEAIEHAVNCYHATKSGSAGTTVANTLLALQNLEKRGRAYADALNLFADERSGVDDKTLSLLQPLAKATLQEQPGAKQALVTAARKRRAELAHHPRIITTDQAAAHLALGRSGWRERSSQ